MKHLMRSTITTFFYLVRFFKKREGIIVLMYHRVNDSLPANDLVVPIAKFREQMEYLKRNCQVISIEQFLLSHQSPVTSHQQPRVVITFDDGYRDNYLNAYPVLKEMGLPATIFLVTGMIGTDQKRSRYKDMPAPDMLNWDEIREMAQNGITFGGHTVSHPHLSQLNYNEQRVEIKKSIDALHQYVQKSEVGSQKSDKTDFGYQASEFEIFCYPYGEYNADTLKVMNELGIKAAFTVKPGINDVGGRKTEDGNRKGQNTNTLELRRTEISGVDSIFDFRKKLAGAFDWMHIQVQKGRK